MRGFAPHPKRYFDFSFGVMGYPPMTPPPRGVGSSRWWLALCWPRFLPSVVFSSPASYPQLRRRARLGGPRRLAGCSTIAISIFRYRFTVGVCWFCYHAASRFSLLGRQLLAGCAMPPSAPSGRSSRPPPASRSPALYPLSSRVGGRGSSAGGLFR